MNTTTVARHVLGLARAAQEGVPSIRARQAALARACAVLLAVTSPEEALRLVAEEAAKQPDDAALASWAVDALIAQALTDHPE